MKSNVITFERQNAKIKDILAEIEKVALYNGLQGKDVLHLRLLAEEVCCMVDSLVRFFSGEFCLSNYKNEYCLCLSLTSEDMTKELKEKLLSTSSTGKNASAKGLWGCIRNVVENYVMWRQDNAVSECRNVRGFTVWDAPKTQNAPTNDDYSSAWYFSEYKNQLNDTKSSILDDLEKSILAKLADEIIVGVKGKKIEIVVKKVLGGF